MLSSKELMYVDDALGHEQICITQCQNAVQTLQDPELKQCAQQTLDKHQQIFNQLYSLI